MSTLAEKRVFTEQDETTRVLVASSLGAVGVSVSGDLVGEFGVDHRCTARDVAARGGAVAVATDEDVLVGDFEPTGHGPAVAVSLVAGGAGDAPVALATAPDGTVSRLATRDGDAGPDGAGSEGEWTAVGRVDDPRRMDGPLVAAADGVHRADDPGSDGGKRLDGVGLDDARDVASGGAPLAAAGDALYQLGNGWTRRLDGDVRAVAADPTGERGLAATPDAVYGRAGATAEWEPSDDAGAVDVAVGSGLRVAVTAEGEIRVNRHGEWRGRGLGLPDVTAVAVVGSRAGDGNADDHPDADASAGRPPSSPE